MSEMSAAFGSKNNPFIVEDDHDDDVATRVRRIEEEARRVGRRIAEWVAEQNARGIGGDEIDDLDQEARIEDLLVEDIAEIIDLTDDERASRASSHAVAREEGRHIQSYKLNANLELRAGMTVELKEAVGDWGVKFLRIHSIIIQPHTAAHVLLRGWGFARTRELDGMLPRNRNDVVLIAQLRNRDPRPWRQQALMDVPSYAVKRTRELRITNAPHPVHRLDPRDYGNGAEWVEEHSPLVCRQRYSIHFSPGSTTPCEWAFVNLDQDEVDCQYKMPDEQVMNRWRGGKVPGGSYNPRMCGRVVVDLESDRPNPSCPANLSPGQRYTAGDIFAGAGGASRGIERAGVRLLFALDHWIHAAESLKSNFRNSDIYEMEVTDFISSKDINYRVDILHLSPPCQFWSPAHTVAGKNDERNIAVLFSCGPLIEKFRPRLFTLEQTFGILSPRFKEFFNALVRSFTEFGYSVRWKVVPLANYGVPQLRKRLIMIGAAPGEKLPPFPPPTHSKNGTGGLKPWATVRSVVSPLFGIRNHPLHRPQACKTFDPRKRRWNPDSLARTVTCGGGQNYHWDGERDFTLAEYAALQGFPIWHKFRGRYIKKQIGNAFPPSVVKVLYDHLVGWLLQQDGFDPSIRHRLRAELPDNLSRDNYVILSSDDDDDDDGGSGSGGEVTRVGSWSAGGPSGTVRPQPHARWGHTLGDAMDADAVDEVSDTMTLREGEGNAGYDAMCVDENVLDPALDRCTGTQDDPYVLSD